MIDEKLKKDYLSNTIIDFLNKEYHNGVTIGQGIAIKDAVNYLAEIRLINFDKISDKTIDGIYACEYNCSNIGLCDGSCTGPNKVEREFLEVKDVIRTLTNVAVSLINGSIVMCPYQESHEYKIPAWVTRHLKKQNKSIAVIASEIANCCKRLRNIYKVKEIK